MSWDDELTGTVRDIAATLDSPLRVMAGPGTGKSFALKRRVARLLEVDRVPPSRILVVTFTRNAARLLLDDLRSLGTPGSDLVRAGTLHSFCFSLLGRADVLPALGRTPRPIVTFSKSRAMQFEGAPMLADLRLEGPFGGQRDSTTRVRAFEAAWARLESETPGWPVNHVDQRFQRALESWLVFHRAMLIGEVVPQALRYLRNNPAAAALTDFDHVLVDEYQDLNRAEQDLVDLLATNGDTAVVGDVDQSIYRFRYANPAGIEDYAGRHVPTHDEVLDQCRRCPATVVSMADHLIRVNHPGQVVARLQPMPGKPPGDVSIVQWTSLDAEVAGLSNAVWRLIHEHGYLPQDVMVLTPRRRIGYRIRNRLRDAGVAVHSFYHEEALESRGAQQAFGLLSLLVQQDDPVALRWWLGDGSPSWRAPAYRRLRQYCEAAGRSAADVLVDFASGHLALAGVAPLVTRYRDLQAELAGLAALSLDALIDRLFPDGDDDYLGLREAAMAARATFTTPVELHDRLKTQITQPDMPEAGDFVRVMSLHKSKGLTCKVVVIAGCIEGLIPFTDDREPLAEQAANLEEQRRLFYVAMTRCTEVLVASSSLRMNPALALQIGAQVRRGGRTIASRFLEELGPAAPAPVEGMAWPLGRVH